MKEAHNTTTCTAQHNDENEESCAQWTQWTMTDFVKCDRVKCTKRSERVVRYLRRWLFNNSHAESQILHITGRWFFWYPIPFSSVYAQTWYFCCVYNKIHVGTIRLSDFIFSFLFVISFSLQTLFLFHLSSAFSVLCIYWKLLSLLLLVFNLLWHFFFTLWSARWACHIIGCCLPACDCFSRPREGKDTLAADQVWGGHEEKMTGNVVR